MYLGQWWICLLNILHTKLRTSIPKWQISEFPSWFLSKPSMSQLSQFRAGGATSILSNALDSYKITIYSPPYRKLSFQGTWLLLPLATSLACPPSRTIRHSFFGYRFGFHLPKLGPHWLAILVGWVCVFLKLSPFVRGTFKFNHYLFGLNLLFP